jgi:hypothetical protein
MLAQLKNYKRRPSGQYRIITTASTVLYTWIDIYGCMSFITVAMVTLLKNVGPYRRMWDYMSSSFLFSTVQ